MAVVNLSEIMQANCLANNKGSILALFLCLLLLLKCKSIMNLFPHLPNETCLDSPKCLTKL